MAGMDTGLTNVLVAAVSGGGGVLLARELIGGLVRMARGVSGRISTKQVDLAAQVDRERTRADEADTRADDAERRYDTERANRRKVDTYAWGLERKLAQAGIVNDVPPPILTDTITPAELREIRGNP